MTVRPLRWRKGPFLQRVCGLLLLLPLLAPAASLTSVSGRFRISGPESAGKIRYAYWAEEDATRLERLLGLSVPVIRASPVEIVVGESPGTGSGVTPQYIMGDTTVRRVLRVRSGLSPATPVLREGLIRLILAGMIEQRRHEDGLPLAAPAIPDWLSAGLVRNLDKAEFSDDREMLEETGEEEEGTPVADVLKWEVLSPEGRGRRAVCGMLIDWLLSFPGGADALMGRMAGREKISAEWLAKAVVGAGSSEGMEARWRAWRRRGDGFVRDFGSLTPGGVALLRRELPLDVSVAGKGKTGAAVVRLRPMEVIDARKTYPALRNAAVGKVGQIRFMTIGKAPELRAVGELYGEFFEAVSRGAWRRTLVSRLKTADAALEQLDALTRARERYLNEFEREGGAGEGPLIPEIEKSRIESYLDEAEKRLHKP